MEKHRTLKVKPTKPLNQPSHFSHLTFPLLSLSKTNLLSCSTFTDLRIKIQSNFIDDILIKTECGEERIKGIDMRVPSCSVCQNKYNEDERCPLLLQCGHGFCRECLSKMFSASTDCSLSCPRCRFVSTVGNSVTALKKNYAILSLIQSSLSADDDDDEDEDDGDGDGYVGRDEKTSLTTSNNCYRNNVYGSGGCNNGSRGMEDDFKRRRGREVQVEGGGGLDLRVHKEVNLVRRIGDGSSWNAGTEMWAAVVSGRGCKHKLAVKKVSIKEETDVMWLQGQLEELRRKSMWCRSVCTFHGAMRMDNSLCLLMDRCYGSVQTAMQQNEGRLTLEQILRFCFSPYLLTHTCIHV